ncbi:CIH_collapsed_G0025400.mRNA.1.CDS.1 [Saccharomyces cerevisiae]|nr:CIH_collapsed_G0025400.mRNA.1.CDS.1 [Saccharomyces cerevisiae]
MIALPVEKAPRKSLWQRHRAFISGIIALIIIGTFFLTSGLHPAPPHEAKRPHHGKGPMHSPKCEKIEPLSPSFKHSVDTILHDPAFRNSSIEKLSNAVRIPTVVQDKNPNPCR